MKYIATEDLGHGFTKAVCVETKSPAVNGDMARVSKAKPGQYFTVSSNYELVPEPETVPGAHKMLCIGADIIPTGSRCAIKRLVLFGKEIGDVHYIAHHDDIFFSTQIDQELLVFCPKKLEFDKPNNGYKILRNLTIDKKRSDYVTHQH